ncbi:hypothetical protein [Amycolatopsis sp. DG1A-15b]|uniref:hypothetical protein n=1 Tax=Amycolatopsis sp. DG1A-15b TaxID=3052846 RepID=UPI00255C1E16|nr:hypothetical protein [Amycolatopsis sp. DG1A-15b]WIX90387.1 hypothetical protein QRY02_08130 [Amycolatopsis sp. DG1A-15b]
MTAGYADPWPVYALQRKTSWTPDGPRQVYRLFDDRAVYTLAENDPGDGPAYLAAILPAVRC